jgi:hypothetical protein
MLIIRYTLPQGIFPVKQHCLQIRAATQWQELNHCIFEYLASVLAPNSQHSQIRRIPERQYGCRFAA